jgi:hypothetical protein
MPTRSRHLKVIAGGRSRRRSRRLPRPRVNASAGVWGLIALAFGLAYFAIEATTLIVIAAISAVVTIVALFAPHERTPKRRASTQAPRRASEEYGAKNPGNRRAGTSSPQAASGPNARCPYCSAGRNCPGQGKCQCKGCKAQKKAEKDRSGKPDLLTRSQLRSTRMVNAEKKHVKSVEKVRK